MSTHNTRILALDTATEACSAALYIDGSIISEYSLAPREHSRLILKMLDKLLADADITITDIDAIAFGCGPGSFMGLRIAAGVVQGIAFAHDIPVIPISTLKAIAQRAYEDTSGKYVLTAIDARMDEVYWAAYSLDGGSWSTRVDECVVSPDRIDLSEQIYVNHDSWVAAGTGWGSYADRILSGSSKTVSTIIDDCLPAADVIVKLAAVELSAGNTVTAAEAIPVYLRNDVAKKPKPVKF